MEMMRMETSESRCAAAVVESRKRGDEEAEECSSSTTTSIGKDSDASSEAESGDNEAQSTYNGPLDMMDSLQQVLPIRRGISKFYNGKSKSFTSLADASASPSVKDIAKPENAYSRRRRNLTAFNHVWDNKLKSNGGGISKRTISSSRSALALAFATNYDSISSCTSQDSTSSSLSSRSPPPPPLPPLHPRNRFSSSASPSPSPSPSPGPSSPLQRNFSEWRSFSVADLQHCATAATIKMQGSPSEMKHQSKLTPSLTVTMSQLL